MNRRSLVLFLAALQWLSGCGEVDQSRREWRLLAMGTWVDIVIDDPTSGPAAQDVAVAESESMLRQFERDYYAWADGELADLNAAIAAGRSLSVSPELAAVLTESLRLSAASEGAFDPGVAALVELWGFNDGTKLADAPPADDRIAELLRARTGIAELTIAGSRISSQSTRVRLDLGGIAKGAAVDRVIGILEHSGVNNAMVNAGGDLRVRGRPSDRFWRIGIQSPRDSGLIGIVELEDGEAAFTSGDYERFFEHEGQRLHHILDPTTGYPVSHTQALTVIAADGLTADAAATALFVAGPSRWVPMAKALGIRHVLRVDASGRIEVSPAMRDRLQIGASPDSDIITVDF